MALLMAMCTQCNEVFVVCGVEYFVAPKISIGAEFGWGLQVTNRKNNETTYERYTSEYEVYTIEDGNTSTVNLDTDNFDGAINVFFHF